ncbi:hypothetical protein H6P81_002895 [Aristolochia fimbriata]|uniref:Uncharacterized protein n=1 Tax=Aristolochia fimbriata TaxID=158543 RepID=A0AAV7FF64_ARIFI|nr:hypothetical protein H6P81_002895 [Aristolochia fimbriata]
MDAAVGAGDAPRRAGDAPRRAGDAPRRKPWETGKIVVIPEELNFSMSLIDGVHRWYLDTVALGGVVAAKLSQKSLTRRAYVRIPIEEVEEVRGILQRLTQNGSPGKVESSRSGQISVGLYEEAGVLTWRLSEKRKKSMAGSVELAKTDATGKGWTWLEKGLKEIQLKRRGNERPRLCETEIAPNKPEDRGGDSKHIILWKRTFKEALSEQKRDMPCQPLFEVSSVPGQPSIVVNGSEGIKCQMVRVAREPSSGPNHSQNFPELGLSEKTPGSGQTPEQNPVLDEITLNLEAEMNVNAEVSPKNTQLEETTSAIAHKEKNGLSPSPKSNVSDSATEHDEQEENEAARPAEERPIYCTYARRRAARLNRTSRSNVRCRPTKVRSSSLPARRKQAQETQMHALPEDEDEERREYDRWLDDYMLRTMSDYGGELGMGQDKIVEFHNRKKASQQGNHNNASAP